MMKAILKLAGLVLLLALSVPGAWFWITQLSGAVETEEPRTLSPYTPIDLGIEASFRTDDMNVRRFDGLAFYRQEKALDLFGDTVASVCFSHASRTSLAIGVRLFPEEQQALKRALQTTEGAYDPPALRLIAGQTVYSVFWLRGGAADQYAAYLKEGAPTFDFELTANARQFDDLLAVAAEMHAHRPPDACDSGTDIQSVPNIGPLLVKHWGNAGANWDAAKAKLKN